MSQRDQVSVSSQHILWVAGMGVGALTLAFVLGIQVGKKSASWRRPVPRSAEEQLKELPEPLLDQLKIFEGEGSEKLVPTPKVDATAPKEEPKKEQPKKEEPKAEEKPPAGGWTLQLVATSDAGEARRVADKAKAAGYPTTTVTEKGLHKVRLAKPLERPALNRAAEKLKKAGLRSLPLKAE